MFSPEQVEKYLERIGLHGPMTLNHDTLNRIVWAHYTSVPYENLDTMNQIPVLLSEEALYDKIVNRHRGGWCFELNAALALLLEGLGFSVQRLAARFVMGEKPGTIPLRRHEVLLVDLEDGQYVCDAGIMRESYRAALKLKHGLEQKDGIGEYKIEFHPFYGNLIFQRLEKDTFEPLMGFTLEPQTPGDYIMPSFYCEHHPDSPFTHHRMVGVYTKDGSINLVGNELRWISQGKISQRRECTEEEIPGVLREYFGIEGIK